MRNKSIWEEESQSFADENKLSNNFINSDDDFEDHSNWDKNDFSDLNILEKENFDYSNLDSDSLYCCYFLERKRSNIENEIISEISTKIPENNKIFDIMKVKKEKKVGRKRKGDHQEEEKAHTKYDKDNIHRKIQVHFLNFLFSSTNEILAYFEIDKKFLNIDYKNKKVVTKDNFENLKITEIGEILRQDISTKYRKLYKIDKKLNNKLYLSEVNENDSIKKFLSETYIDIFLNLYYKNKRDLNDYGLNIQLTDNVKTYQNLLDKNNKDKMYVEKIKKIVKDCYLPKKFVVLK